MITSGKSDYHIHLANHQNELHAKTLLVMHFSWSWTTVPIG